MRVDLNGHLWVAAGIKNPRGNPGESLDLPAGVYVISPAGKLLGRMPILEDLITNVAFGGPDRKTLYVTAGERPDTFAVQLFGVTENPSLCPKKKSFPRREGTQTVTAAVVSGGA